MSRAKGDKAEAKGCSYLKQNGFMIIDQNYYSRFGEIDIIALKEGVYHFIEVKSAPDYETAIYNITPSKLSKIIKTIEVYKAHHKLDCYYCIDALIVTPESIELVEDITN